MSEDPGSTGQPGSAQPAPTGPGDGEPWSAGLVEGWRPERPERPERGGRRRRGVRIALASAAAIVVLAAGAAVGGYALVNHLAGNIHRIPNVFGGVAAANRPVMPAATSRSITILLAGSEAVPASTGGSGAAGSPAAAAGHSGLIALVHINANRPAAAIVSIPPNALVHVPAHGVTELYNALPLGGPSLLIRTVERLTNVRVDHYLVVDFNKLATSVGPLGGVNVDVPAYAASNGVVFHPGTNHLTAATAIDYLRATSHSEDGRVLAQQALLYAVLERIAAEHPLTNPAGDYSILTALTKALSVDSNFTNSELESLAMHLRLLGGSSRTFVSAPVARTFTFHGQSAVRLNSALSHRMWQAIRNDAVAAFARRYPSTVTQ